MEKQLWLLEIAAPESVADLMDALLAQDAPFGWQETGDVSKVYLVHCEEKEVLEDIRKKALKLDPAVSAEIREVGNKDWQSAWRQFFTPVEAGDRFVILPPWLAHLEHTRRQEIIIDPKNAFGTGHHASTVLCLEALNEILDKKRLGKRDWFLDLGCGTGILGIAACKAGLSGTGLDIDPVAIANSRENRELNEAESLELLKGGIEKVKGEKFALIMANILAQPLIDMAPEITACLKKDGCLVLGGILDTQVEAVTRAYMQQGLPEPRVLAKDEWRALVWD